jgi:hypothetical protein
VAGIAEKLATYTDDIQERIVAIDGGICDRCKYLPTIADIDELARPWKQEKFRREREAREAEATRKYLRGETSDPNAVA